MFVILTAILATAGTQTIEPACKTVTVCKPKTAKPKPKPAPKPKAPTPETSKACCPTCCDKPVTVVNEIKVAPTPVTVIIMEEPRLVAKPSFGLGLRGAVGLWSCGPHAFGVVGLRARAFKAHLGAEVNTQFYWGHSAQLMVYPVQGPVSVHVDLGAMYIPNRGFGTQDVPRKWDVLVGAGIEVPVLPHISLTADARTTMPNPVDMVALSDQGLRHGAVIGNSFARTQLMLGVMLHSW